MSGYLVAVATGLVLGAVVRLVGLPTASPPGRPCADCPWRRDTPPGKFPASRYAALRATTVGPDGGHAMLAPMFACHNSRDGEEFACAGWLAVAGLENVTVRLLLASGEIPPEALRPGPGWPELFSSYDEMAAAQAG